VETARLCLNPLQGFDWKVRNHNRRRRHCSPCSPSCWFCPAFHLRDGERAELPLAGFLLRSFERSLQTGFSGFRSCDSLRGGCARCRGTWCVPPVFCRLVPLPLRMQQVGGISSRCCEAALVSGCVFKVGQIFSRFSTHVVLCLVVSLSFVRDRLPKVRLGAFCLLYHQMDEFSDPGRETLPASYPSSS